MRATDKLILYIWSCTLFTGLPCLSPASPGSDDSVVAGTDLDGSSLVLA